MVDSDIDEATVTIEAVNGGGVIDQLVGVELAFPEQRYGWFGLDLRADYALLDH